MNYARVYLSSVLKPGFGPRLESFLKQTSCEMLITKPKYALNTRYILSHGSLNRHVHISLS